MNPSPGADHLIQNSHPLAVQGPRPARQRPALRRLAGAALAAALALGFTGAMAAANPSWAPDMPPGPTQQVGIGSGQGTLPVVSLGTWMSQAGEDKTAFLTRVGAVLKAFAGNTGHEACGTIWQHPGEDRWAVPVTSNGAHAGCVATNLRMGQDGWVITQDTIHVHPEQAVYRINAEDRLLLGMPLSRGVGRQSIGHAEGDGFSTQDFKAGPGYVVAAGRLLYQRGTRTVQDLGNVPALDPFDEQDLPGVFRVQKSEPAPSGRRLALR